MTFLVIVLFHLSIFKLTLPTKIEFLPSGGAPYKLPRPEIPPPPKFFFEFSPWECACTPWLWLANKLTWLHLTFHLYSYPGGYPGGEMSCREYVYPRTELMRSSLAFAGSQVVMSLTFQMPAAQLQNNTLNHTLLRRVVWPVWPLATNLLDPSCLLVSMIYGGRVWLGGCARCSFVSQ